MKRRKFYSNRQNFAKKLQILFKKTKIKLKLKQLVKKKKEKIFKKTIYKANKMCYHKVDNNLNQKEKLWKTEKIDLL